MVLINGRQVYMVDYGRIVWGNLPVQLNEIRQIEVIKGPNSALYGFNAVGGVINIITYDPLKEKRERRQRRRRHARLSHRLGRRHRQDRRHRRPAPVGRRLQRA